MEGVGGEWDVYGPLAVIKSIKAESPLSSSLLHASTSAFRFINGER